MAKQAKKAMKKATMGTAPHKFTVRYQLKSGARRKFDLRAKSKRDAAKVFLMLTGFKLGQLKSASVAYNRTKGQPKAGAPVALVEVL